MLATNAHTIASYVLAKDVLHLPFARGRSCYLFCPRIILSRMSHEQLVCAQSLRDPVVIANLATSHDPEPCVPQVKEVQRGSFKIRCKEPANLDQVRQKNETVAYMVCSILV